MIFTKESVADQIKNLLKKYKELKVIEFKEDYVKLQGVILVNRKALNFSVTKKYKVEITIPINSNDLPYIFEIGGAIDNRYHHVFMNGKLCLEGDTKIRMRFINGFDLIVWMDEFVEVYFFSYEYYKLYNEFPFGERSHGIEGILEVYQDIFKTDTISEAYNLMEYVNDKQYRGHLACPCGSGKIIRKCHGDILLQFYKDNRFLDILKKDFTIIKRTKVVNDEKRNSRETK